MTGQELLSTLDTTLTYPRVHKPKSALPRFGVTRALGRKPAHLLLAPSCWAMQAHQALGYPRSCLAALCLSACFSPNYSFVHVFFKQCLGTEESELKDTNWWNILIFCHSLYCSAICPGWVLENFHHPQFPGWEWATRWLSYMFKVMLTGFHKREGCFWISELPGWHPNPWVPSPFKGRTNVQLTIHLLMQRDWRLCISFLGFFVNSAK